MAEIGKPVRRRVLVPDEDPATSPPPAVRPPRPEREPAKVEPEKEPA